MSENPILSISIDQAAALAARVRIDQAAALAARDAVLEVLNLRHRTGGVSTCPNLACQELRRAARALDDALDPGLRLSGAQW